MKKLLTISIAVLLFAACNKKNNNTQNSNNGSGNNSSTVQASHWIPNWANDTLVGGGDNPNATKPGDNIEVIYSLHRGDTSMIRYHGVEYYIWAQCPMADPNKYPDWFTDNNNVYNWVYVGTRPFDTTSSITKYSLMGVFPSKYYNSNYGTWHEQYQSLFASQLPFPEWVSSGFYSTEYKQALH